MLKKDKLDGLQLHRQLRILQVLSLAISSETAQILGCNKFAGYLGEIFENFAMKHQFLKERNPYLDSTYRLLFHIVNNSIDSGWCPHVLQIYEGMSDQLHKLDDSMSEMPDSDSEESQIAW